MKERSGTGPERPALQPGEDLQDRVQTEGTMYDPPTDLLREAAGAAKGAAKEGEPRRTSARGRKAPSKEDLTALAAAEKVGELISVHVIPRPHAEVDGILPHKAGEFDREG